MFDNPGSTLKSIARSIFILSIIGGVIYVILSFFVEEINIIDAFWYAALGVAGCYLTSLVIAGLGSIVEDTATNKYYLKEIAESTRKKDDDARTVTAPSFHRDSEVKTTTSTTKVSNGEVVVHAFNGKIVCPKCGFTQDATNESCSMCGFKFKK